MTTETTGSRTAAIRALARTDPDAAAAALTALLSDLFGMSAGGLTINRDQYSLNSLNGFFEDGGERFFFKFHQEENEAEMSGEYYRADILANAGLPVDQPLRISRLPGEQILVYRRRDEPRFSDVLLALDLSDDPVRRARAVAAERDLSDRIAAVQAATLRPITESESRNEPIHRLFHERLVNPATAAFPGGRLAGFYVDKRFRLGGIDIGWDRLSGLQFVVNGRRYRDSLGTLFTAAHDRLSPDRLADAGGVVAHGDAHNANVWYSETEDGAALTMFDPAFAGSAVPSLLAEVKATFHNVFAHPLWLYDPALAARAFRAEARIGDGALHVETDWRLTAVRRDLLAVKADRVWRPLLARLADRGLLPADWRRVVRLALFLCPTLVMNLRAGAASHNETSSLIGLSVAVAAGSEPVGGTDDVCVFLDRIDPEQR